MGLFLLKATAAFLPSANSAGPNHSLRIRWSEEMVGSLDRSSPKTIVFSHCFRCGVIYMIQALFLNHHQKRCCSDIVFPRLVWGIQHPFQRGLGNSSDPNHSLRIRWFVEIDYTISVRHKKQCCSDIVFCQISLGDPTPFSKGVGRIRWSP